MIKVSNETSSYITISYNYRLPASIGYCMLQLCNYVHTQNDTHSLAHDPYLGRHN